VLIIADHFCGAIFICGISSDALSIVPTNRKLHKMDEESSGSPLSVVTEDAPSLFSKYMDEYCKLMIEGSQQFLEEKKAIEDAFANKLRIIENYRKSRKETILQEGLYFQQVEDDQIGSK
jgi:hypothetical protein